MDVANFGLRITIARVHLAQTTGRFSVRFSGELTGKNPNYINARGPGKSQRTAGDELWKNASKSG